MWLRPIFPYKIGHFSLASVPKLSRHNLAIFWCRRVGRVGTHHLHTDDDTDDDTDEGTDDG